MCDIHEKGMKMYQDSYSLLYLVDYVFIVADVVLKGYNRLPGVILGVNAAAGCFTIFMASHSQRISEER